MDWLLLIYISVICYILAGIWELADRLIRGVNKDE
jgi:hypothetical protein